MNAIGFFVVVVVTHFMGYVQNNEQARSNTQRESENIDQCVELVLGQVARCNQQVILKHVRLVLIFELKCFLLGVPKAGCATE
jgi:hypothetical protein